MFTWIFAICTTVWQCIASAPCNISYLFHIMPLQQGHFILQCHHTIMGYAWVLIATKEQWGEATGNATRFRRMSSAVSKDVMAIWKHWWQGFWPISPGQNGSHFADDIFICILLSEKYWNSIVMSLQFVPKVPIHNLALVLIMAWHWLGEKSLS